MKFAIIILESASDFASRQNERAPAYWEAWKAYMAALNEAGIPSGGAALQAPETATVVRVADGRRLVQDGPYADTKEPLGGFLTIDVPDLDQALHWAALCPAASSGAVEVRPVLPMM